MDLRDERLPAPGRRKREKLELVAGFLDAGSTLALATATPEGSACVAPLFYLPSEGLRLYWFSSRSSEHSRNLERNPHSSVTVYHSTARWQEIRGVQMRGDAVAVSDRALRRSIAAAYVERFHLGRLFEAAISKSTLYCFQPDWVRYIDNSVRFGFKFEMSLAPLGCQNG